MEFKDSVGGRFVGLEQNRGKFGPWKLGSDGPTISAFYLSDYCVPILIWPSKIKNNVVSRTKAVWSVS